MIKKVVWFLLISILLLSATLIFINVEAIWEALSAFPKDRILCYLLGAATAFAAQFLAGSKNRPARKSASKEHKE